MKRYLKPIVIPAFLGLVSLLSAGSAYAQFTIDGAGTTTSAITTVTNLITSHALVVAGVVTAILALLAALVGLGWGVRKFLKWVGGRKF